MFAFDRLLQRRILQEIDSSNYFCLAIFSVCLLTLISQAKN